MTTTPIHVAVNGYGVIDKRVADAVRLQTARVLDIPIFGATAAASASMRQAGGLVPDGDLDDLLADSDIVVDCTPLRAAAEEHGPMERADHGAAQDNRDRYVSAQRKAQLPGRGLR